MHIISTYPITRCIKFAHPFCLRLFFLGGGGVPLELDRVFMPMSCVMIMFGARQVIETDWPEFDSHHGH
jgi:hypothetical protein